MKSRCVTYGIFTILVIVSAFAVSAQSLQYNVDYMCNGEHVSVGHCRRDSDMPGYPRTTDAENFCMVYYLDRPKQGGFIVQKVELRNEIIQNLQKCGAFDPPSTGRSSGSDSSGVRDSGVGESVTEFNKGDALFKKKDYAGALDYFKRSNAIAPSSAAWIMSGISHYYLKQYTDAIISLKETVRMAPANPEARHWLGLAYKDLAIQTKDDKLYPKAEAEFREAIRLKPDYHAAYLWLGSVLSLEQRDEEAVAMLRQALRLDPKDTNAKYMMAVCYAKMRQKENAMLFYREVAADDPKMAPDLLVLINKILNKPVPAKAGTAEYYVNEGNKLRDKKEYEAAIDQYKKALEIKPTSTLGQVNLGFCFFQMGDFKLAQERFQQAVWLDPKDATNQYWLGVAHIRLKQYKQALPVMQEAVKLDPSSPYNHYNLAEAYLYWPPDYPKAVQEFREALRLKPDYDEVHNQLGLGYLWQNQYQAALTEFQTAMRLSPKKEPIHYENVGIAYFRLGKKAEAMQIYAQLKELDAAKAKELLDLINSKPPSKADALATQAKAEYEAHEFTKAVETCKKALTLDPRNSEALGYLALSYRKMYKWDLAVAAFANYFAVQKPYFDGMILYGEAYEELEKFDKAIPLYRQALTLASNVQDKKDAYFKIGNAYYELNDYPKALDPYLQVTLLSPKDDDALYHLGMCYMFTGKKAEAQQVQKRLEVVNKISAGNLQGWIDRMK